MSVSVFAAIAVAAPVGRDIRAKATLRADAVGLPWLFARVARIGGHANADG